MTQITLNLDTEASLEQYAKKVSTLLDEMRRDENMKCFTGTLETELIALQKAIYRARMLKRCSVSVDINLIQRIELALLEWIKDDDSTNNKK